MTTDYPAGSHGNLGNLPTSWDRDDSGNLKKITGATGATAALLVVILILQIISMVLMYRGAEKAYDQQEQTQRILLDLQNKVVQHP